jgi:hypothetical protein
MKTTDKLALNLLAGIVLLLSTAAAARSALPRQAADDASPPERVVKLIFIHHSTGENWLRDDYGRLGIALGRNNYFVSDTNYGWGPDGIGDRTDIPNWTEWFASDSTARNMEAVFNESGQNSAYTRTLTNPGGENEIVVFKSCFPNSALEGNPNDPPGSYEELSVSGAKYVYNTILQYFATRPDKLFVVITAPPLSDGTYAKNARAFNNWLLNDWLRENNYTLNNVAVFDFYNILTGADAHHRVNNGQVEHILGNRNTLHYPSGDDHPSEQGSRKATEEFLPMLNVFYHRWMETASLPPAPGAGSIPETGTQPEVPQGTSPSSGVIDDFESGAFPGSTGWEAFRDEATSSTMTCGIESATGRAGNSLRLDFNIAANSWGTCALFYDSPQDWSAQNGVMFYFRAAQAGMLFDIDLYAGPSENRETYLYTIEAPAESVNGWVPMELRWEDFYRADWEENGGAVFAKPNQVSGLAFGLGTLPDAPNTGSIWVDDLSLLGTIIDVVAPSGAEPTLVPEQPGQTEQPRRRLFPCGGALILPFALVGFSLWRRRRA